MGISQLGYIGIGVSDIKAWEQFATGVLGLEVSERGADGTLYLRMDEHHHRLALYPTGQDDVTCSRILLVLILSMVGEGDWWMMLLGRYSSI